MNRKAFDLCPHHTDHRRPGVCREDRQEARPQESRRSDRNPLCGQRFPGKAFSGAHGLRFHRKDREGARRYRRREDGLDPDAGEFLRELYNLYQKDYDRGRKSGGGSLKGLPRLRREAALPILKEREIHLLLELSEVQTR